MGIPAANNGGANSTAVAEHTLALILALYKRLPNSLMLARQAKRAYGLDTFELAGKLVGIVSRADVVRALAGRRE